MPIINLPIYSRIFLFLSASIIVHIGNTAPVVATAIKVGEENASHVSNVLSKVPMEMKERRTKRDV
jgi:hypothetical protein